MPTVWMERQCSGGKSTATSSATVGGIEPDLLNHHTSRRFLSQGWRRGHGGAFGSGGFCSGGLYRRRQVLAVARVPVASWRRNEGVGARSKNLCRVYHTRGGVLDLSKSSHGHGMATVVAAWPCPCSAPRATVKEMTHLQKTPWAFSSNYKTAIFASVYCCFPPLA